VRRRALLVLALLLAVSGCRARASQRTGDASPVGASSLPQIVVRDDSSGLTFSYITLEGGFRQVTRVLDVPYEARDAVRVWSVVSGDGINGPYIYLADLRTRLPDTTYKVEVVPRGQFEELAVARREKGVPKGQPIAGANDDKPLPKGNPIKGALTVIIYGADWCKPCHDAERYLTSKGIPYVHKDIDDPAVSEEMGEKLRSAGIKTHNIPVLDVAGKILVGFSATDLDRAIAEAKP
jgi:glutaredoxin